MCLLPKVAPARGTYARGGTRGYGGVYMRTRVCPRDCVRMCMPVSVCVCLYAYASAYVRMCMRMYANTIYTRTLRHFRQKSVHFGIFGFFRDMMKMSAGADATNDVACYLRHVPRSGFRQNFVRFGNSPKFRGMMKVSAG